MNKTMYNNRQIFTQAWERVRKTGETFQVALTTVWDWHRKKVNANKSSCSIIEQWQGLNSAKKVEDYILYKNSVNVIIAKLKAVHTELVAMKNPVSITTANIIASVVSNKGETPSYRQLFAILCGAWENGIKITF